MITGSGMDHLFPAREERSLRTRFGSARAYVCAAGRREFLFLPRHGKHHSIPPHRINFRANMQGLKEAGVERIIATSAVGSISRKLLVGELGLLDQFIDLSKRHLTFFDRRPVHVDMTHPYDKGMQDLILDAAAILGMSLTTGLVYVSVDGPRYETAAEIRMFGLIGGDVVGMTGGPEAILANELGMRYASVVVATNWAAGMQDRISHEEVVAMMNETAPRVKRLIEIVVESA
ncbi:MAG: MTAP family purine nucleoside phosphorylase [Thaumarchaeota archaeon]|nr:MTAP family purine nucleoside phosphorylase [Nitrososphaerota archaeon]